MRDPHTVLVKPMVSEKALILMEDNKYCFFVDKNANKIEIKHAVESLFNVHVLSVTTRNMNGKMRTMGRFRGKRPDTKRAIVKLAAGEQIELFSSLQ
ncbi:MAG: 50S ribosomal protein L23 [Firmicutes bacterium]|nr:50S ribosomal protein L23 [Bacillota bacterium]